MTPSYVGVHSPGPCTVCRSSRYKVIGADLRLDVPLEDSYAFTYVFSIEGARVRAVTFQCENMHVTVVAVGDHDEG